MGAPTVGWPNIAALCCRRHYRRRGAGRRQRCACRGPDQGQCCGVCTRTLRGAAQAGAAPQAQGSVARSHCGEGGGGNARRSARGDSGGSGDASHGGGIDRVALNQREQRRGTCASAKVRSTKQSSKRQRRQKAGSAAARRCAAAPRRHTGKRCWRLAAREHAQRHAHAGSLIAAEAPQPVVCSPRAAHRAAARTHGGSDGAVPGCNPSEAAIFEGRVTQPFWQRPARTSQSQMPSWLLPALQQRTPARG